MPLQNFDGMTLSEQAAQRAAAFAIKSAANDAEVAAYAAQKAADEQSLRERAIKDASSEAEEEVEVVVGPTGEMRGAGTITVLTPTEVMLEVPTVPGELVNYSLVPTDFDTLFEITPGGGELQMIPPVIGTMMVMLGRRMLVSMAIGGLQFLAMEPLQQYGKGLPRAKVLWHTGRSPGKIAPARRGDGPFRNGGSGYSPDDPFLDAARKGFQEAWDYVKKQWSDPASFVPWLWGGTR